MELDEPLGKNDGAVAGTRLVCVILLLPHTYRCALVELNHTWVIKWKWLSEELCTLFCLVRHYYSLEQAGLGLLV